MSEKLKPCPFCGGEACVLTDDKDPKNLRYYIMCIGDDCGLYGAFDYEEEAIEAWNKRATRNSSSFFHNADCEYFPCHKVKDTEKFNCIFCYCPLYDMDKCPGTPEYLPNGIKDCTNCTLPHSSSEIVIELLKTVIAERR